MRLTNKVWQVHPTLSHFLIVVIISVQVLNQCREGPLSPHCVYRGLTESRRLCFRSVEDRAPRLKAISKCSCYSTEIQQGKGRKDVGSSAGFSWTLKGAVLCSLQLSGSECAPAACACLCGLIIAADVSKISCSSDSLIALAFQITDTAKTSSLANVGFNLAPSSNGSHLASAVLGNLKCMSCERQL